MELKIGYWNINRRDCKSIGEFIIDLLKQKDLDLLLLSEYSFLEPQFSESVLPNTYRVIKHCDICKKVLAIQKNNLDFEAISEEKRYLLLTSNSMKCLLVGLHLKDNTNGDSSQNRLEDILRIMEAAKKVNLEKEIYVGDYNCMPYSKELVYFKGMHSVLFKDEMKTKANGLPKHYNPMLLRLNEENHVYGSFRYNSGEETLYWYSFDQVIVSKPLMNSIEDIEYVKQIAGKSLMSSRGSCPIVSDHLPLTFVIKGF